METLHINFCQLFDTENTKITDVVIPKIQRAYAQGRTDVRTTRTRTKFLEAIHRAVSENKTLTLDFVYGKNDIGTLVPLDGQQRLTTLFLLYWYASRRAGTDCEFLRHFSYDTRYSAREFIERLLGYQPDMNMKLSEAITDEAWFPLDWRFDPTIEGMLVMLDDIQRKFADVDNLLQALDNIKFYFLPIQEMGLTDDIYIKMNSRGKPLTDFEHFKAEFEKVLKDTDQAVAERIIRKIDVDWTDFLWPYKGDNNIIDDEFLRYFRFICDILCYQSGQSPKQNDEFELIKLYFTGDNAMENILKLERFFDCWLGCDVEGIFNRFISEDGHEKGKIQLFHNYNRNFLKDCLDNYADVFGNRNRKFRLNQIIILYAFTLFRMSKGSISDSEFERRLRIVYNLVNNSSDEISDSETRIGGNRMPAILKQVDSIILNGVVSDEIRLAGDDAPKPNFNANQLEEERAKLTFTNQHPELSEPLFVLEDHKLLQGKIDVVGLEYPERFAKFRELFDCDWDLVDCAMLATGNYYRRDNDWRIQMGSKGAEKAWRELFNSSSQSKGYEQTKRTLAELLSLDEISNEVLRRIASEYIIRQENISEYPWQYYYLKYPLFRPGRYGKYTMYEDRPYRMAVIWAPQYESTNTYQPFLYGIHEVDRNYNGWRITMNNFGDYLWCDSNAFVLSNNEGEEVERFLIPQTENGIDIVDRILFGKDIFQRLSNNH